MKLANNQSGLACAAGAFVLWGIIPIYFKMLEHVSPMEVLGHRVFWSSVLLIGVLFARKQLGILIDILKAPKLLGGLVLTSLLIAGNWLCFIWGVTNDRILETSLGYYINPLFIVLMGYFFFGERLTRAQAIAVVIACSAVVLQIIYLGKLPWVALVLPLCFAFYGLIRKRLNVDPAAGLAVETILLMPVVSIYFLWLMGNDEHAFRFADSSTVFLLALAGLITTVPLVLFNMAAKALSMTVLGIMQYVAPSISFLVGVFLYDEPLGEVQLMTFGLIWTALIIFTFDGYTRQKRQKDRLAVDTADAQ